MENQVVFTALLLAGVVVGVSVGVVLTALWNKRRSSHFRIRHGVPDILGEWRCRWFDDGAASDQPKVEDTIEIEKWVADGEFTAHGYQPQFSLRYPIAGEVDPSRVVTLVYKAARYPYEPNRGIACLQLSRDGRTMEGRWYGRRSSGQLGGGKVEFFRLTASRPAS